MRILFVGDVVGTIGRETITTYLPKLKKKYRPQVTIINGENAANGKGITEKIYKKLLQDGADVVTTGNHVWDNREIFDFIDSANKLVRPANFPTATTPGKGICYVKVNSIELAVINLQARIFMTPISCPFEVIDKLLVEAHERTAHIFIDFHGETTSEKQAMGWYVDGRVSAICGTHTHVQTNDSRILPNGTAYLTDVGMTGSYDGVLGVKREIVIDKFKTSLPHRFEVDDNGRALLSYCVIDIDDKTGKAHKIEANLINEDRPFRE